MHFHSNSEKKKNHQKPREPVPRPIDLDAGRTQDHGEHLEANYRCLLEVCLFSCWIERVAIFAFIVKKKREAITAADPRGGGWGCCTLQ